jgi:surface polysaccharide O-acyltransferase-like enzyme
MLFQCKQWGIAMQIKNSAENRNGLVDLSKYIAALMVIAIHTAPLSDVQEEAYFILVQVICRMAVPFFAVCTGYFTAMHCKSGGERLP